jgi:hypothetical protein
VSAEDVRFDGGLSGEPFCACGRVVSMCDRSRAGCTRRSRAEVLEAARSLPRSPDGAALGEPHVVAMHDDCDNRGGACSSCRAGGGAR